MRCSVIVAPAFFATLTIFINLPSEGDRNCRPTGTHLNDTSSAACTYFTTSTLSKTGNWNINWPDGFVDGLSANGSGECSWNSSCDLLSDYGTTNCWPLFHPPETTSDGGFSLLVESQVIAPEIRTCPNGITTHRKVFCSISGRAVWLKPHQCSWGGGSCQDLGQPCSSTADCCSGICGELSSTCVACEPNPQDLDEDCMSETCASCYQQGGVYCNGEGGNCWTPIVVDVDGNGFNLTNATNGVNFNDGRGTLLRTAWTAANSDDSWLVLDRNGNGAIDDGTELFGNATPQPATTELHHGFRALNEYDRAENGGNGDGFISNLDSVFVSLRLWRDINHDGVSTASELYTLPSLGLASIDLNHKLSKYKDANGNTFKFRAKIKDSQGVDMGRWVYDVFLDARRAQ